MHGEKQHQQLKLIHYRMMKPGNSAGKTQRSSSFNFLSMYFSEGSKESCIRFA
jgi:hypothetical protein